MKNTLAAAVLTGGKSSRMGTDKAFLPLPDHPGETFLSHTLRLVEHFPSTFLSVAKEDDKYLPFGIQQVADHWPEIGPMGGIASCLSATDADALLILACDTPFLSETLIARLEAAWADHPDAQCIYCTDTDGRMQPLCAIYAKSALPFFLDAIERQKYALRYVIDQLNTFPLLLDAALASQAAANINTPEEYRAMEKSPLL
ncbi:MAG: molybdenum cofactor guanylyltransferase [Clostridia bacterium]|nr:molybdenum cofactor guanylyltransferase [Clostridia bacterium]